MGCCESHLQSVLALVTLQHLVGVYAHCQLLASATCKCTCLFIQSRNGLTDTRTCPIYVCASCQSLSQCVAACVCGAGLAQAGRRTYISPFSNRFFKLSLMASLEILLISVRSETPTSFFLVVSKTALVANWALGAALAADWPPTALRAARLVFPYTPH